MEVIWILTRVTLWISGSIGLVTYSRLSPIYKLIVAYILLAIGGDLTSTFFEKNGGYNLFVIPIYSFLELTLFSSLYYLYFIKSKSKLLLGFTLLMHSLILLDIIFLADFFNAKTFYAFGKVTTDLTIVIFCLVYYWKTIKGDQPINKELFRLNSIFISYFLINLLIFLSINFLINESLHLVNPFWMLNALSALFLYLFLTYMIWQHGKTPKTSHFGSL